MNSTINLKPKKPLGWWYHKILCELGWKLRNATSDGWDIYYCHLNKMCNNYKINLYGERI